MNSFNCLVLLVSLVALVGFARANHHIDLEEFIEKRFVGYNKHQRPGFVQDHPGNSGPAPDEVQVQVVLAGLHVVSETLQNFEVDGYLRHYWTDARLAWNTDESEDAKDVAFIDMSSQARRDRMWIPDTYVVNSLDIKTSNHLLWVYPDGYCWYSRRVLMKLTCNMNFTRFPFDIQSCPITVSTWAPSALDVLLNFKYVDDVPVDMRILDSVTHTQWNVSGSVAEKFFIDFGDPWSYTQANLILERQNANWMMKAIFVTNLVFALCITNFFIDPTAAPARAALAVITVLTFINLSTSFQKSLPEISYSTWLDMYMRIYIVFSVLALCEFAAVNFFMGRARKQKEWEEKQLRRMQANAAASPRRKVDSDDSKIMFYIGGAQQAKDAGELYIPTANNGVDTSTAGVLGAVDEEDAPLVIPRQPFFPTNPAQALDFHARWLFPVAALLFNVAMFVSVQNDAPHFPYVFHP